MKKSNIINKNKRIIEEVRNEVAQNTIGNSSADDQIFENIISDDNLLNSKTRNIYAIKKFKARRSN